MNLVEFDRSYKPFRVAGIDEAGRGCLAGPVYAAAAILKSDNISDEELLEFVNDSKKLSEKKREKSYEFILKHFEVAIGTASAAEIDHINILQATKLAMKRAYDRLAVNLYNINHIILIDGNFSPFDPNFHVKNEYVISGDAKSLSIAAASIVAKVMRDVYMKEISNEYPDYMWDSNKGYGTKDHMLTIEEIGITVHHRKTFIKSQQSFQFA